jgi:hypothetical protein
MSYFPVANNNGSAKQALSINFGKPTDEEIEDIKGSLLTGKYGKKVDILEQNTVLDRSLGFRQRVSGWITFHFQKITNTGAYAEAKKKDIQTKQNTDRFNSATTKLINALYQRPLSPNEEEAYRSDITVQSPIKPHMLVQHQNVELNRDEDYTKTVNEFNEAFVAIAMENKTVDITKLACAAFDALKEESERGLFYRIRVTEDVTKSHGIKNGKAIRCYTEVKRTFDKTMKAAERFPTKKLGLITGQFADAILRAEIKNFESKMAEDTKLPTEEAIEAELKHLIGICSGIDKAKIDPLILNALIKNLVNKMTGDTTLLTREAFLEECKKLFNTFKLIDPAKIQVALLEAFKGDEAISKKADDLIKPAAEVPSVEQLQLENQIVELTNEIEAKQKRLNEITPNGLSEIAETEYNAAFLRNEEAQEQFKAAFQVEFHTDADLISFNPANFSPAIQEKHDSLKKAFAEMNSSKEKFDALVNEKETLEMEITRHNNTLKLLQERSDAATAVKKEPAEVDSQQEEKRKQYVFLMKLFEGSYIAAAKARLS